MGFISAPGYRALFSANAMQHRRRHDDASGARINGSDGSHSPHSPRHSRVPAQVFGSLRFGTAELLVGVLCFSITMVVAGALYLKTLAADEGGDPRPQRPRVVDPSGFLRPMRKRDVSEEARVDLSVDVSPPLRHELPASTASTA